MRNPDDLSAERRAQLLIDYLEVLRGFSHRGQSFERGKVRHIIDVLTKAKAPEAGWLQDLTDRLTGDLPAAPTFGDSPTSQPEMTPEPGRLEPSELAWLQHWIEGKPMAEIGRANAAKLTELAMKTAGTPDELYVRSLYEPLAKHWNERIDRKNATAAEKLKPVRIDRATRTKFVEAIAGYLAETVELADVPDDYRAPVAHDQADERVNKRSEQLLGRYPSTGTRSRGERPLR
jgi:hypothetical protein